MYALPFSEQKGSSKSVHIDILLSFRDKVHFYPVMLQIVKSDQEARAKRLKGAARYDYIKRKAGLSPETDDAEIRQYLRKGRELT